MVLNKFIHGSHTLVIRETARSINQSTDRFLALVFRVKSLSIGRESGLNEIRICPHPILLPYLRAGARVSSYPIHAP
jgi:hypothetical protein